MAVACGTVAFNTQGEMHPGMLRLRAVCVALCVAASTAFAPLSTPPAVGRAAGRNGLIGLRAASSSPEPLSRRELGRALVLLGGASMLPAASQAKMTKATAEDTVAAWNKLMDAKEALSPDVVGPMVEVRACRNKILSLHTHAALTLQARTKGYAHTPT